MKELANEVVTSITFTLCMHACLTWRCTYTRVNRQAVGIIDLEITVSLSRQIKLISGRPGDC